MTLGWLWRFDWKPELRDLVLAEADALDAGEAVAPGLFVGETPLEPGRAAFVVGGGHVLDSGAPESLTLPEGQARVHVVKGPWRPSGTQGELVARLPGPVLPGPRSARLRLYATGSASWLVDGAESPHFVPPELPFRTSTSLPSQLARAVVNLVAKPGDVVLDPVCGTGVLLVEAGRIGCALLGGDLNRKALWWAGKNLAARGREADLQRWDARDPSHYALADALVADLPYGRRLDASDLEPFARALPLLARRWALVAHVDLSDALRAAGHPPRLALSVPKPTFTRYVLVGQSPGPE